MPISCETIQDELMSLLYEGEEADPAVKEHVKQCSRCSQTLQSYQKVQGLFRSLPELSPSPQLTDALFDKIEHPVKRVAAMGWLGRIFMHPASVAAIVFVLTLSGTLFYKKYFPGLPRDGSPPTAIALKEGPPPVPAPEGFIFRSEAPSAPAPAFARSNLRMVDWNPMPRLIPDLERPLIKTTDTPSLEQASVDSVAAFKHHIALRHILDGDLAKADQILDSITENYLNYSHWEQAVFLHMSLMKRLGRTDEIQRDIARLKEYAMTSPAVLAQFENEIR